MAEYRQWRETERVPLHEVIPLETPYNLSIEVSSLCNAKCVYCAHSKDNHGQFEGNMPDELFQKILSDLGGFKDKIKKVGVFGFGEPLCNPRLPEMIKEINDTGKVEAVDITTNGLLMTPQYIDKLMEAEIGTIRISLQGLDEKGYRDTCGVKMDFDVFLANLQYLYNHKGKTKIRMKIADTAIRDISDGEERFLDIFSPIADSVFVEHIMPIYSNINYDGIDARIRQEAINGREKVNQERINKVCHRAFYRCRIRADGRMTAACCDSTQDVTFGNVYTENVVDIWNGKKRKEFLKQQLLGKRFLIPECHKCIMPNDITTQDDLLDPWTDEIMKRME